MFNVLVLLLLAAGVFSHYLPADILNEHTGARKTTHMLDNEDSFSLVQPPPYRVPPFTDDLMADFEKYWPYLKREYEIVHSKGSSESIPKPELYTPEIQVSSTNDIPDTHFQTKEFRYPYGSLYHQYAIGKKGAQRKSYRGPEERQLIPDTLLEEIEKQRQRDMELKAVELSKQQIADIEAQIIPDNQAAEITVLHQKLPEVYRQPPTSVDQSEAGSSPRDPQSDVEVQKYGRLIDKTMYKDLCTDRYACKYQESQKIGDTEPSITSKLYAESENVPMVLEYPSRIVRESQGDQYPEETEVEHKKTFGEKAKEKFEIFGEKAKEGFEKFGEKAKGKFESMRQSIDGLFHKNPKTDDDSEEETKPSFGEKIGTAVKDAKKAIQKAGEKVQEKVHSVFHPTTTPKPYESHEIDISYDSKLTGSKYDFHSEKSGGDADFSAGVQSGITGHTYGLEWHAHKEQHPSSSHYGTTGMVPGGQYGAASGVIPDSQYGKTSGAVPGSQYGASTGGVSGSGYGTPTGAVPGSQYLGSSGAVEPRPFSVQTDVGRKYEGQSKPIEIDTQQKLVPHDLSAMFHSFEPSKGQEQDSQGYSFSKVQQGSSTGYTGATSQQKPEAVGVPLQQQDFGSSYHSLHQSPQQVYQAPVTDFGTPVQLTSKQQTSIGFSPKQQIGQSGSSYSKYAPGLSSQQQPATDFGLTPQQVPEDPVSPSKLTQKPSSQQESIIDFEIPKQEDPRPSPLKYGPKSTYQQQSTLDFGVPSQQKPDFESLSQLLEKPSSQQQSIIDFEIPEQPKQKELSPSPLKYSPYQQQSTLDYGVPSQQKPDYESLSKIPRSSQQESIIYFGIPEQQKTEKLSLSPLKYGPKSTYQQQSTVDFEVLPQQKPKHFESVPKIPPSSQQESIIDLEIPTKQKPEQLSSLSSKQSPEPSYQQQSIIDFEIPSQKRDEDSESLSKLTQKPSSQQESIIDFGIPAKQRPEELLPLKHNPEPSYQQQSIIDFGVSPQKKPEDFESLSKLTQKPSSQQESIIDFEIPTKQKPEGPPLKYSLKPTYQQQSIIDFGVTSQQKPQDIESPSKFTHEKSSQQESMIDFGIPKKQTQQELSSQQQSISPQSQTIEHEHQKQTPDSGYIEHKPQQGVYTTYFIKYPTQHVSYHRPYPGDSVSQYSDTFTSTSLTHPVKQATDYDTALQEHLATIHSKGIPHMHSSSYQFTPYQQQESFSTIKFPPETVLQYLPQPTHYGIPSEFSYLDPGFPSKLPLYHDSTGTGSYQNPLTLVQGKQESQKGYSQDSEPLASDLTPPKLYAYSHYQEYASSPQQGIQEIKVKESKPYSLHSESDLSEKREHQSVTKDFPSESSKADQYEQTPTEVTHSTEESLSKVPLWKRLKEAKHRETELATKTENDDSNKPIYLPGTLFPTSTTEISCKSVPPKYPTQEHSTEPDTTDQPIQPTLSPEKLVDNTEQEHRKPKSVKN